MKILAAYKPTAEGRAALETAAAEARLRGADLVIVRHAADADRQGDTAREELASFEERFRAEGINCKALLRTGDADASDEILRTASEEAVDMIVVGVRRRSPVGKAFLGSESQDILLNAECPVMAVKAD